MPTEIRLQRLGVGGRLGCGAGRLVRIGGRSLSLGAELGTAKLGDRAVDLQALDARHPVRHEGGVVQQHGHREVLDRRKVAGGERGREGHRNGGIFLRVGVDVLWRRLQAGTVPSTGGSADCEVSGATARRRQ